MSQSELSFTDNDPGAVRFAQTSNEIVCLDIGCNTGELTKDVCEYLQSVVYPSTKIKILGVDIDATLIERAIEQNNNPNITYISLNITNSEDQNTIKQYLNTNDRTKFDIVFCFSVTMWIHINNGDNGLQEFLKYIKTLTRSIIIEPQPWKCYRNAQRRLKKAGDDFPLYRELKIRSNVDKYIENFLLDNKMIKVYESPSSSWDRRIVSFHYLLPIEDSS